MNIDVENARKSLKDFRGWGRAEKSSYVPIAARRNLKKYCPGFLLQRVKHRPLPVVPQEGLRSLPEANKLPRWSAGKSIRTRAGCVSQTYDPTIPRLPLDTFVFIDISDTTQEGRAFRLAHIFHAVRFHAWNK